MKARFTAALAVLLLAFGPAADAASALLMSPQSRGVVATAGGGGGDPYALYTSFNRNNIPWHASSGVLGTQESFEAPTAPTTTSTSTCDNSDDCFTAAAVNGRQLTVTGWTGTAPLLITGNDVTVIIEDGVTVSDAVHIQGSRVRIRGETLGTIGTALIGQIRTTGTITDLHVDGVNINGEGPSDAGDGEKYQCVRPGRITRFAITNVRMLCPGYGYQDAGPDDYPTYVFFGNVNMYAGAWPRATSPLTFEEGWAMRVKGGPVVIVDSIISTTRYATIRWQTHDDPPLLGRVYMKDSKIVNLAEARATWFNDLNNCTPACVDEGFVYENVDVYAYSTSCFGEEISREGATYAAWNGGTFYNAGDASYDQTYLDSVLDATSGLSFSTWSVYGDLSWGSLGDPSSLVAMPSGFGSPVRGDSSCAGIPLS